jgi:chitinase
VTTAIAVVVAVIGGAVAVPLLLNNDARAATVEAGPRWFGGYFDVTAAKASEVPTTDLEAPSNIVLSFVVAESEDSCVPSWGTYYGLDEAATGLDLDRRIARMRQDGAQIAVSFGGALNTDLAAACESMDDLVDAYAAVIDRYDVSVIDLDIEGANLSDLVAGARRAQAVAELQKQRRADGEQLEVWLTLPVATSGLLEDGLEAVDQMLAAGVELAGVNVMTMDYGVDLEGRSMAEASIDALTATAAQLTTLYAQRGVRLPAQGAWAILGATPMIGQNDVEDEIFTIKDAAALNSFADSHHLSRMSMWSLNRDRTCGPNYPDTSVVSDSCSGVQQDGATFAAALAPGFDGRPSATITPSPDASEIRSPRPAAAPTDDPATSPYPVWSADAAYSAEARVVWRGNVYAAKWWVQGGTEPDDPTLDADETAWTLVGPVLPTDRPWTLPTAAPGTYPDWSATAVYVKGDRVLFGGTPFEAQWWTQGDNPSVGITDQDRSPWGMLSTDDLPTQ